MEAIISEDTRRFLLSLARQTLLTTVAGQAPPRPRAEELPGESLHPGACFATLTRNGSLRGCIGQLQATQPIWLSVIEAVSGAALRDPRFPPVAPSEVTAIKIHLSVLSKPETIPYSNATELLQNIRPGEDGLILNAGGRTSTFLPKVWEKLPDKLSFLEQLSLKAGLKRDAWQSPDTIITRYRTVDFEEE